MTFSTTTTTTGQFSWSPLTIDCCSMYLHSRSVVLGRHAVASHPHVPSCTHFHRIPHHSPGQYHRHLDVAAAAQGKSGARRKAAKPVKRGFGKQQQPRQASSKSPEKATDNEAQDDMTPGPDEVSSAVRAFYQVYNDAGYKPPRFVGPVEVHTVEGHGRSLVASKALEAGELLFISKALSRLPGGWKDDPPTPEDLHMAWLEDGITPAQRRVLSCMYDGSEESMNSSVSLATWDARFWESSRGKSDSQAPAVSSGRLLNIINNCACADSEQDVAAMTLRHEKPTSYIGLWAEYSLLNHSCVPNTAIVVIQDRMLVHSANVLAAKEELTRNYVPQASTAPATQRQAALKEAGYDFTCNCPRCRLEASVSDEVREALTDAYDWYAHQAVPRFQAAAQGDDPQPLQELLKEAEIIVEELESLVDAEPGLTDIERTLLRAAAYDTYDMLCVCDEFVHQERATTTHVLASLELLQAMAPGSESHVHVAYKYQVAQQDRYKMIAAMQEKGELPRTRQMRAQLAKLEEDAQLATEYYLHAWVARYGYCDYSTLTALTEAFEVYTDAVEQLAVMESEGQSEAVSELDINGVKVQVVDRADLSQEQSQPGARVKDRNGVKFTLLEEEEEEAGSGADIIDIDHDEVGSQPMQLQEEGQGRGGVGKAAPGNGDSGSKGAAGPGAGSQRPDRKLRLKRKQ